MTAACSQCGGSGGADRCRELFDHLLALDRVDRWSGATYAELLGRPA